MAVLKRGARFGHLSLSPIEFTPKLTLEIAAENDCLPNKNILKQVAELELNIVAVENNLAELESK